MCFMTVANEARQIANGLVVYLKRSFLCPPDMRREPSTSCEAAVRIKPKARLYEPWVNDLFSDRAPKGRQYRSPTLRRRSAAPNLLNGFPRLAKPRLGLSSADRFAAFV